MRRSSPHRLAGMLACVLAALLGIAAGLPSPAPAAGGFVPDIVGGQQSSISQFPWQVFVLAEIEPGIAVTCGGSILDATHVLTAAHCVDHEGTTASYPASSFEVLAGASEVLSLLMSGKPPAGAQLVGVASLRTHPYYQPLSSSASSTPETKDDVAVLTLGKPLELAAAANAQAIGLVAAGATPAPGTALSISGYGKENGAEGVSPDGKLYSTSLTALSSDSCRQALGANSAVLLCAQSSTSTTCQGDSGGPLTQGTPAVEVGIVDFGRSECPVNTPDVFTNIAAPEVRAFIEGSQEPPVAARLLSAPALRPVGTAPVDYSPLSCEPGGWSGAPSFSYTFQTESSSPVVLQSGPSDVYLPQSNVVGGEIVCVVQAANAGGVTTARSAGAVLQNDVSPPVASFSGAPRCHLQSCTLAIRASDPNAVALSVRASASYAVASRCPRRRRSGHRHVVCHITRTVALATSPTGAGRYSALATRLPYGEAIRFSARASNAASLTQEDAAVQGVTLHRPKAKKKKKR